MSDKTNSITLKKIKTVSRDNLRIKLRIMEGEQQRHELFIEVESLRKQLLNNIDRLDSLSDDIKEEKK